MQVAPWRPELRALWCRIAQHNFEPDQALNFTTRLARDKGWQLAFAREAIWEYRRFCFLAVALSDPVTPSEEVDEVWHLHLTYTRDYWQFWCRDALGVELHHEPTLGGPAQRTLFRAQYASTLHRYEGFFGPPPADFWPATHERFRPAARYRTVDGDLCYTVPRPRAVWRRLALAVGARKP